jgi:uncharacterized OB-fold protein
MTNFKVERDEVSAPFFDAAAAGVLMIRRCPVCGSAYPPYQRRCSDGSELEWEPASGRATLVSWAVDHAPALDPALAGPDDSSSLFGLVELEEGPWLQVPLVGVEGGLLREGIAMRLKFIRPGNGEAIPAFTRT